MRRGFNKIPDQSIRYFVILPSSMKLPRLLPLIASILICELAGIIGSLFTAPAITGWYKGIVKPSFNPLAWVFGPVWTTLFFLMGISAFLIYEKGFKRQNVKRALSLFAVQLTLNTLWSILFFGFHNPTLAFLDILLLWLAILATIISFSEISSPATWLLIPYLLWVTFAAFLNLSIVLLNAGAK